MVAIKISIILAIGSGLAATQSISCKKDYYQMCCEADYDLQVPITTCVPLSSMSPDSNGNPYCGDGIDTMSTFFDNCCNYANMFSQTCSTDSNEVQTCETTVEGVKCTSGGIN